MAFNLMVNHSYSEVPCDDRINYDCLLSVNGQPNGLIAKVWPDAPTYFDNAIPDNCPT